MHLKWHTRKLLRDFADIDYKYAKQSGGRGQYGHVKIKVNPAKPGEGYSFLQQAVVGGAIPKEYIPKLTKVFKKH